jgi:exoribonuclease R
MPIQAAQPDKNVTRGRRSPARFTTTMKHRVGVLEFSSKFRYGLTSRGAPLYLFRPYSKGISEYIVGSSMTTTENQIAIITPNIDVVTPVHAKYPRGNLVQIVGPVGSWNAEYTGLLQHYCPYKFAAEREFSTSAEQPIQELSRKTGWITFHIDPVGCRDIDDAIAYHPKSKTIAISIANVAIYVPPHSDVDTAAKQIGATFYTSRGAVEKPMLPPSLSEHAASLVPGKLRRALTYYPRENRFEETSVLVEHSFTYESFPNSPIYRELYDALTEDERKDAHVFIENAMKTYNIAAATRLKERSAGLLRVQRRTELPHDVLPTLSVFAWAEKASYEVAEKNKEQPHNALQAEVYCHVTSPLRRYADLVNQRILVQLLREETPEEVTSALAEHLNERMKANRHWTRDLLFLTHVTPGKIHTIDVLWMNNTHVWVPLWKRMLRIRHVPSSIPPPGTEAQLEIYCDIRKRNWKERVMTREPATRI